MNIHNKHLRSLFFWFILIPGIDYIFFKDTNFSVSIIIQYLIVFIFFYLLIRYIIPNWKTLRKDKELVLLIVFSIIYSIFITMVNF